MRFGPGLLLLTLSSVSSHAVAAEPNGCDHILGAWEYVPPSWPGRAILARQGNKCVGVWFSRDPKAGTPKTSTEAERAAAFAASAGGVWEYDCDGSRTRLRCRLRMLDALDSNLVGAVATHELEIDGDDVKWWDIGADGKRSATPSGATRRLR